MYDKTCYMVLSSDGLLEPCIYFGDKAPKRYIDYDPVYTTVVIKLWYEEVMLDPFEYNMHVKNRDYQAIIDMADDVLTIRKDDDFSWDNVSYYI